MPVGGLQVEVDARVHAALAEVAVERSGVAELAPSAGGAGAGTRRGARAGRPRPPSLPSSWPHPARTTWRRAPTRARPRRAAFRPGRETAASTARPGATSSARHQPPGLRLGVGGGVAAELHVQPALALRQQREALGVQVLLARVPDEHARRCPRARSGPRAVTVVDGVGREEDVGEPEHEQRPARRARHQAQRGLEDRDAGAFRSRPARARR